MSGELRYIRLLKPLQALENPGIVGKQVPWLSKLSVFASNTSQLSAEPDFQQGRVVGMDAASALAVELLDVAPGMQVLDLCAAPGMKLAAIAELMGKRGVLVGVDVSENRLFTTCAVLRKYGVCAPTDPKKQPAEWEMNLYQQDGRTFDLAGNKGRLVWNVDMNAVFLGAKPMPVPRKRVSGKGLKKKLAKVVKAAAAVPAAAPAGEGKVTVLGEDEDLQFDRVLVDAECTTDARLRNSNRSEEELLANNNNNNGKKQRVFSKEQELETQELQFGLLSNGFALLKPGGTLVYSTCSMMRGQNEDVVKRLLDAAPNARLVKLPAAAALLGLEVEETTASEAKGAAKTWRLTPEVSGTSGLFIAKITKLED